MRLLLVGLIGACTKAPVDEPPKPVKVDPIDAGSGPGVLDAAPHVPDAAVAVTATEIHPLAVSGPYKTLRESCEAARPCGETDLTPTGSGTPATTPHCEAVLDQSRDVVAQMPASLAASGRATQLVQPIPGGEIRIAGLVCDVPPQIRGDHSEHYVFIKRGDGWWRTTTPVFEYSYNNKYCGGSLYILWNTKPARTIAGIAVAQSCLACGKQTSRESMLELMVRIETTGAKPLVFAPLMVGVRERTTFDFGPPGDPTDPTCKATATATSMKERWVSDDEVVLEGPAAAAGLPREDMVTLWGVDVTTLARAGRYRFTR